MSCSADNKNLYVVIPAAGSGTRMGPNSNKLFMEVGGVTVIERTLQAFMMLSETGAVNSVNCIVVTNEENISPIRHIVDDKNYSVVKSIVLGGNSRTDSVYNGLKALSSLDCAPTSDDFVFVHDGARCMVTLDVLNNCIESIKTHDVCVAGVPAKNTIKVVNNGIVTDTPDRSTLYEVQTPQCFKYDVIMRSYENAFSNGIQATDDTALAELLGYKVAIAEGSYGNIKITTPEDILFAQAML